jgi:tRNA-2-methylthio-N6-dimethylallyladenosine synthase
MAETVLLGTPSVKTSEWRRPTRAGKQYLIRTFGCQMNEHDSERVAGLFEADGMARADDPADADVIFVNTCTIRENADTRLYGTLGHLKALKDARPGSRLIVGGCAAQKDRDLVRDRAPWVDVVVGTHNLERVLTLLDQAEEWGPITEILDEPVGATVADLPARREHAHSAWVTIQTGCNNTCTFCIVPSVRGGEVSRRPGDVIREVQALAADGVVEVTLLGQNVNTYGRDLALDGRRRPIFGELLRRVGEVDGIRRIRFTSPHPADISVDVAEAMAETPAVCEQLHFPLQSGSRPILARMHRGYTPERFLERLELVRDHVPDLTVSTDVIVGFPGETEADFQATLDVVAEARFDSAFMFIFSPRPGTAAAEMAEAFVDPEVVKERFQRLLDLQGAISRDRNEQLVGRRFEVLSEGPSDKDPTKTTTRTRGGKLVHVDGPLPLGRFGTAEVTSAATFYLTGSLV